SRRPNVIWAELPARLSPRCRLCRQDTARCQACRSADRAADQVRFGRQPDHCAGTRPRSATHPPRPRRRGDRMSWRRRTGTLAAMRLGVRRAVAAADARPRLAFLALGPQQNAHLAFVEGLRRLGYAQGRNVDIDHRYGDVENLKPLAQELIALKPDILVA